MKRTISIIAAALISLFGIEASAQNRTISGTITGSDGEVLVGATALASSGAYSVADIDGTYTLKVKDGDIVTVSFFGYDDKIVTVEAGINVYNVVLAVSEATMLNEAVMIGYGTTTKKEITGSVASLKAESLDKGSFTDAAGMLQGKVAGLSITNPNGGDPSSSMEIILRGTNTLSAGQGPLIIIDGVVGADLSTINFQEVESIDVLKDGSAAAIYGTRGTNGVIIITTKRAKSGKTAVEYDGQVTTQTVLSRAVPMTAEEFRYTANNYVPSASSLDYGYDTDWFREITRTPVSHKHNLAISGGAENFSHRTVLNLEKNQGLLKNNNVDKYLFKTNIHQEALKGWLVLDYNMTYAKRKYEGARWGIFRQAFLHNPTEPVYDKNDTENGGYFTVGGMDYYNPVAMLNERSSETEVDRVGVNARATLNILSIPGLKWDNFISYGTARWENRDYRSSHYPGETSIGGTAEITNNDTDDLQWESTVQYSKKTGKHSIQAVGGYTYQEQESRNSYMMNQGFVSDFFKTNNMTAGAALKNGTAEMSSSKSSSKYIAFFGRVIYNYDEKYLLSASLRRDGSSRFGANNKWGWFPAISGGWRISKEEFMKDLSFIDDMKIRAGYGVTGNQDFDSYKSLVLVKPSGYFYFDGKWQNAYALASNPNPDLGWERKSEFNAGVDFSFLGGLISGALDYYYRYTDNLLYNYNVPVPPYDYSTLFANVGAISNSGVELSLYSTPVKNDNLKWDTSLVLSHNTNKLEVFSSEEFQGTSYKVGWLNTPLGVYCQKLTEGESLGTFFGPEYIGQTKSGSDKVSTTKEDEYSNLGSAYPWLTAGWSNSVSFGRFTASATIRGSFGGKVFNQMRAVYQNLSYFGKTNILESWLDDTSFTGKITYSSKYLEDATYVKLDNISLSYDVPIKKNDYVRSLSIYATGQNLLTLTGYTGVDPEVSLSGLAPGIEGLTYYPRTRAFTIGAKLNF